MEKELTTALIAAGSSIATVLIFKPIVDRQLLKFQLKQNYIAEQSKKIKEHIATHKGRLLSSAELLNSRLKNFAKNCNEPWLQSHGNYVSTSHYMDTTVYRFLAFFANIKLIEKNLNYLDGTTSQKEDLRMLKYFRVFHEVMCDVDLFNGFQYDKNYQTDHFFTTPFYNLCNSFIVDNKVIDLDDFMNQKQTMLSKIGLVYKFFDSLSPNEARLRCERIKSFQLLLIAFLTEFGYDYQRTTKKQQEYIKSRLGNYKLLENLKELVRKFRLSQFHGSIEQALGRAK
jgi:hypothetical protein